MARTGATLAKTSGAKTEEISMKLSFTIDYRKAHLYLPDGRIEQFASKLSLWRGFFFDGITN